MFKETEEGKTKFCEACEVEARHTCGKEEILSKSKIREILGTKAVIDYEKNHSHYHCWNQTQPSACGIKLENHKQCCLCEKLVPKETNMINKFLEQQEKEFIYNWRRGRFDSDFSDNIELERILFWHKNSIKQLLQAEVEELKGMIVYRPEQVAELNRHLDSTTQEQEYMKAIGYCEAIDNIISKKEAQIKELEK